MVYRKNSPYSRDFAKGWDAWEKIKPYLHGKRYILVKSLRKIALTGYEYDGTKGYDLTLFTLIDVQKTVQILQENYELFRDCLGRDFDPCQIVMDAENPQSPFWSDILGKNGLTYGLLYGFGRRNAELWTRRYRENEALAYASEPSIDKEGKETWKQIVFPDSVESLRIPGYMSFERDDRIELYSKEKEQIKRIYRGQNFLETTLQQFTK
jgi:hypothetical protein